MVGQVDEQADAGRDLLDHHRRVVGVREIGVLVAELRRRDQVVAQFRRRPRAGELRADDVLALRIAIQQQPIGPDDVLAGEAGAVLRHGVCHDVMSPASHPPGAWRSRRAAYNPWAYAQHQSHALRARPDWRRDRQADRDPPWFQDRRRHRHRSGQGRPRPRRRGRAAEAARRQGLRPTRRRRSRRRSRTSSSSAPARRSRR